jgi:hypothetical protein
MQVAWDALWRRVETATAWSFKDSWATNLTAIGAVFGTVLSATGVLDELLPGFELTSFTAMNLVFGAIVVLAPLVYAALGRRETKDGTLLTRGSRVGLFFAAAMTLWAVYAQLFLLWVLIDHTNLGVTDGRGLFTLFVAGWIAVGVYSVRSLSTVVAAEAQPAPAAQQAPTLGPAPAPAPGQAPTPGPAAAPAVPPAAAQAAAHRIFRPMASLESRRSGVL